MPPQRKFKARVIQVIFHDENVRTFCLKPEVSIPSFKTGQFLHLAMDYYDPSSSWPNSRAFSIVSSEKDLDLKIIVARKGPFTNRMFEQLVPGREVWIRMPFGIFNLDNTSDSLVLIAGGTGISPFISFLQSLHETEECSKKINLFYGIRKPELVIIDAILEQCIQKVRGFNYSIYCETGQFKESSYWKKGILPVKEIITERIQKPIPEFFLSGPKGMIEAFEKELKSSSIPDDKIFFDKWE